MHFSNDIRYIGVNDTTLDLFEGQFRVPNGMSYNSYLILDEKTAVLDSVDAGFAQEWLENIRSVLGGRAPDYLIIQHMEPDHSGSIRHFVTAYPQAKLVASPKAFSMMRCFFGSDFPEKQIPVKDGSILSLGRHSLTFLTAPMVHWPEVIMTYDSTDQVLFSADAFGKFGTWDTREPWAGEARRYYIGIVGKYGLQVQNLLKKAESLKIRAICPLHGPVLTENIRDHWNLYTLWAGYHPEENGILIAYTSVYGNTQKAVQLLAEKLTAAGQTVILRDLARCDMTGAVADAFRYSKLVLATTTYNGDIFPFMREYIHHLTQRNFRNRTVGLIENGSWAPQAARIIRELLANSPNITYAAPAVRILSALSEGNLAQLETLAQALCE